MLERNRPDEAIPTPSASDSGLRVLFDVAHPAQVHLFRNALDVLEQRGHETFVTSREKEDTVELLDAYDIPHQVLSTRGDSLPRLIAEMVLRELRFYAVARRFAPDVIVSRPGPVPAHVSALLGCRYVAVSDTHTDTNLLGRLYDGVTLPFVDTICLPDAFDLPIADEKRRSMAFQELAYLHPQYFEPDPTVLERHGIDPAERFFVLRVAGWDAYHDVGYAGLSPEGLRRLVELLTEHGEVYISAEQELPADMERYRLPTPVEDIHHVFYYADLYVGDSGTMSTEAAVLGTPAVRTNTMVGSDDESTFQELEHRYGLLRSFANEEDAIRTVEELLVQAVGHVDWHERRNRLVSEQCNVTERLVEVILETDSPEQRIHP